MAFASCLLSLFFSVALAATPSMSATGPSLYQSTLLYGHSRQGRPLTAYVLGKGSNVTLVLGGIHGNEPSSPGVVDKLRQFLMSHPGELAGCEVVLAPNVNPDGDAAGTRANAAGVDLNRNFPYGWMPRRHGVRLSPGTGPLSEPESRALVSLLDEVHPAKVVDIHQPLDTLVGVGPAGRALAYAMKPENHYAFTTDVGYPTPGSLGSYLAHVRHIACVTLELPHGGADTAWAANKSALIAAIHFSSKY